jgi:hypothetical protein
MKKYILLLGFALLFASAGAQTLHDSVAFDKGLALIASSQTAQDYINAGQYFADLTNVRNDEWLAPLYAALSYVLAAQHETNGDTIDDLCDKAQVYIDTAKVRYADVSEAAAMQAFLYQVRITVNPTERGLIYAEKADAEIKKAEAADPADPRPYFLHAMNVYYTPKIFGGGPSRALPLFEQAAVKFDAFVPAMPFMPHWGEQQNDEMIAKCKQESGQ